MPNSLRRLEKNTRHIALAVAAIVAFGIPAIVHYLAIQDLLENVTFKAKVKAAAVSSIVASNPDTWRFAENRLQGLISREPVPLENEHVVIRDIDGSSLAESGAMPPPPVLSVSQPLHDAGLVVGQVDIVASYRSLATHTLFAALVSLLLGAAVYFGVKLLPLRALRLATEAQIKAQSALQAQIERDQQLQEAQLVAHLGSYDWDPVSGFIHWSDEHFRLWGLTPGSVPPSYAVFVAGLHPEDRNRVEDLLQKALRGECSYNCEHRVIWPDGSIRHIHGRGTVTFDSIKNPQRMFGTVIDITESKRAQEELKTLNQELEVRVERRTTDLANSLSLTQATLESTENGILVIDLGRRVTTFNRRFGEMWGIPVLLLEAGRDDEMLGFAVGQLADPEEFMAKVIVLYEKPELTSFDLIELKDGRVFERRSQPQRIGSQVVGRVWSFLDVTERRQAEKKLLSVMDELVQARGSAEASNLAKSEFLANMSHEIRTPLNGVIGLARIGARENTGRKTEETCLRILEAGEHLLRVVNDILDFSKIEAGKLAVEARPFRLASVIDQCIGNVVERAREKDIELVSELDPSLPVFVRGDALRLGQILLNLLSNAVKFTEQGEVRMTVANDSDFLRFSVRDTGVGIGEDVLARLFQPFEQADKSTTRKFGGSGLGLVISRKLAELMGGMIAIESVPGKGSDFTLRLPLPEAAPVEQASAFEATPGENRLAGLRVLAAEDVEINRLVLDDLLQTEGAIVTFSVDGQQAVTAFEAAGREAFDVVLMDIQMPVMDGFEATRRILDRAPGFPVIGLTAHAMAEERDRCLATGMVAHVTKPIDPKTLIDAILKNTSAKGMVSLKITGPVQATPIEPVPDAASLLNWERLLVRYNHRQAFIDKLVTMLIASHSDTPHKLVQAAEAADFEALRFLAHTLKGVGGNIEAESIQTLAKQTENSAKDAKSESLELGKALALEFELLLDVLRKHLARPTA